MEKQLTITDLSAKFTKDFDSFGKMDPYLELILGKNIYKTQTAQDQGKNPKWTATFTITFLDESQIEVKAYDVDVTQNQYMGTGKIDLNALKASGDQQIKISDEKGVSVGTVSFKYELKKLAPTPFLIIKNIHCQFLREAKFILSSKPYFEIVCDQNKASTDKKEGNPKSFDSSQTLRVKIQQKSLIKFNLLDDNQNGLQLFSYQASARQFRQTNSRKQFNINGKDNEPLGVLQFDYETLNLVTREESAKTLQKERKEENQMSLIQITKIKGNLNQDGNDVYFKIILGGNLQKTTPLSSAKKDFILQQKVQFYAQSKQNKIIFVMYDKDVVSTDDCLGSGVLQLEGLGSGEKTVNIAKHSGASIGSVVVTLAVKKVQTRSISISNIQLKTSENHDMIGQQQPYVISRIGGWSARTETGQGKIVNFKKNLELKYNIEDAIIFQIWEQDVTSHEKLSEQTIKLSELQGLKGIKTVNLTTKDGQKQKQVGTLSFKYQLKNPQVVQKKAPTQKKIQKQPSQRKIQKPVQKIEQKPVQKVQQKNKPTKTQQKKDERKLQTVEPKHQKTQLSTKNIKAVQQKKLQTVEPKKLTNESNANNKSISNKNQSQKDNQSFRDNVSIDRSKDSFKLPNIVEPNNYGDRIFDKQSAATLQKSILVYSMPKASRFGSPPKYCGEPSYYVDSCFKPNSGKGVGFGFGYKRQFPQWLQRNMKENPAPGAYIQAGNKTQFRVKGPTFGISHKYYQKVTIPKQMNKTKQASNTRLKPIQTSNN